MFRQEYIASVAETITSYPLSLHAQAAMTEHVDQHVIDLLMQAMKFMRHAHRTRLTVEDIQAALRVRNVPPMLGYSSLSNAPPSASPQQPAIHVTDAAMGLLNARGGASASASAFSPPSSALDALRSYYRAAGPNLYYVPDAPIDLESLLAAPLPPVPGDSTFSVHWLAVEGEVPSIAPNAISAVADYVASTQQQQQQSPSPAFFPAAASSTPNTSSSSSSSSTSAQAIQLQPFARMLLSHEQQTLLNEYTSILSAPDSPVQDVVFDSVANDDGLHQLLPYLVHFAAQHVSRNLTDLPRLRVAVKLMASILRNPYFFVEPYLHQLTPALLTCVLSKRLCEHAHEDHWALRDQAASLLATMCRTHSNTYPDLQPRVLRLLVGALLDPSLALTTHYGAIVGVHELGHRAVRTLLVPFAAALLSLFEPILLEDVNVVKREEANRCFLALLHAVGQFIRTELRSETSDSIATNPSPLRAARRKAPRTRPSSSSSSEDARMASNGETEEEEEDDEKDDGDDHADGSAAGLPASVRQLMNVFGDRLLPFIQDVFDAQRAIAQHESHHRRRGPGHATSSSSHHDEDDDHLSSSSTLSSSHPAFTPTVPSIAHIHL